MEIVYGETSESSCWNFVAAWMFGFGCKFPQEVNAPTRTRRERERERESLRVKGIQSIIY